jgi:hypothetical protein
MSFAAIEGFLENGQIHLPANTKLPERGRVFVLIPDAKEGIDPNVSTGEKILHLSSPRLANPSDAAKFTLKMGRVNGK